MTTPDNQEREKARNAGISLYPREIAQLRALAEKMTGGNISDLVRQGLAALGCDLDQPDISKPSGILSRLAYSYIPATPHLVSTAAPAPDQAAHLARWLSEAHECLEADIPIDHIHLAGSHEISMDAIPAHAQRFRPRVPRARWIPDAKGATYPTPRARSHLLNEPKPAGNNRG